MVVRATMMTNTMMRMDIMSRSYSELIKIDSFLDRYKYLKIGGRVGEQTFGSDRYMNQILYHSSEWRHFRSRVILRDLSNDMAMDGYEIFDKRNLVVHHINPITVEDILNRDPKIFDMENVVCVSLGTHNAIHYGDESQLPIILTERFENDTCPWK